MKATVKGMVKSVSPWKEFQGSSGKTFSKWGCVVDDSTSEKYENIIPLTAWDRSKVPSDVGVGDIIEADFYLKGRESSDGKRIFLNCNVAEVRILERADANAAAGEDASTGDAEEVPAPDSDDDLPF